MRRTVLRPAALLLLSILGLVGAPAVAVAGPAGAEPIGAGNAVPAVSVPAGPADLTVDGGAVVITNSPTPALSGSAALASGELLAVSVDGTTLPAAVRDDGRWDVTVPVPLADGAHAVSVTATTSDGTPAPPTHSRPWTPPPTR